MQYSKEYPSAPPAHHGEIAPPNLDEDMQSWPPMQWPEQPVSVQQPSRREILKLRVLIVASVVSLIALFTWLLNPLRIGDPLAYYGLTAAVVLRAVCWLMEWYNYWSITVPPVLKPRRKWTVDILTTACPGEPAGMIVRTLKAMAAVRYPHTNYLCDEGDDPYLKQVCEKLGIVHVTRDEKKHAKAGNINNALKQATGQIAVVLDPDHEPAPYLLERTLGYFEDPTIGFVQSVQAYRNQKDSFVARGAAEQSYNFYGPYMMGMHGHGTTQAIGANCVFRRAALDSIGGHAPGLAEDMHTSMRLYSKGWRSVYVPEILTRGLVPSTLSGFYKQQIKWACGVFDLLFLEYPRLFKGFTLKQKIQYLLCPVFFLRGLVGLLEMAIPILCLAYGLVAWRATLPEIVAWFVPVLVFGTLVRLRVQRWLLEPHERGLHFAGGILGTATWWVYLVGVACAVCRIKVPYIPTPKEDKPTNAGDLALPNFVAAGVLVCASTIGIYRDSSPQAMLMAFLACINALSLVYASVASQQVAVMSLWQRLAPVRRIARPAKRTGKPARAFYHNLLRLSREGSAVPTLVAVGTIACCLGALLRPTARDTETPFGVTETLNVGGFYTGIDLGNISDPERLARKNTVEKQLDFHFRIVALDQAWGEQATLPIDTLKQLRLSGAVPMLNWLPTTAAKAVGGNASAGDRPILKAISDGNFDNYLQRFAEQVRLFGEPVMICFAPHADDPQMPWSAAGGNSAADFVAAWRHIVAVFDREGAANATWVWNAVKPDDLSAYFPSDAGGYVDWISITPASETAVQSFAEQYDSIRSKLAGWHLPIMLADVNSGDFKSAAWARSAMVEIATRYPEVKGIVFKASGMSPAAEIANPSTGDDSKNFASAMDAPGIAAVRQGLKLKPFSAGAAQTIASDHPLWFDLHPTAHLPPYITGGPGHFTLMVDGAPFYIKGVAYNPGHDWRDANVPLSRRELDEDFSSIAKMGGNTIRRYGHTWSDRNIFNAAADQRLKVLYGFWFFQNVDYSTDKAKEDAYESQIEQTVLQYRDHPGLLGWCLGNEVWGLLKHQFGQPYLTEVRHAHVLFIEKMARRIKELDPNHPVFCAQESKLIAGAISEYARGAPSVDVISVNSYYENDIAHLDETMRRIDPQRPYLISEFGPDGYWDDENNHYDRQHGILEATAMEKAWDYAARWRKYIQANAGHNLGGIAYCWSDRYEGTATWFGITDLDHRPKPACSALRQAWFNPDPPLAGTFSYGGPKIVNMTYPTTPQWPGEPFIVKADVATVDKEPAQYIWTVTGPDFNTDVGHVSPLGDGSSVSIQLPAAAGWYRVQLKVLGKWGLDEANVPVLVQASHSNASIFDGIFSR